MFSNHVTKDISAYCHGELSNEDSKRFAEHIISCVKCRTKFEEVKLGIKIAEQLPRLSAPDHLWSELEPLLGEQRHVTPTPATSIFWTWRIQVPVAVVLLLFLSFEAYKFFTGPPTIPRQSVPNTIGINASWLVTRLDGTPKIGTETISNNGRLAVGEWLETDAGSRAQIAVGQIGNVEIEENTRVRLLANEPREHRLELKRGKISAQILAPPRIFFVDTPSAVAADLGCAYTLEVDDHGGSILRVTSGWVALELEGRESIVPAGASCETRPVIGPGTPYFEDASQVFRYALKRFDSTYDGSTKRTALTLMLDQARARDTLTLWHLLPRVGEEDRVRVYNRMIALVPSPGVALEPVVALDEKVLTSWKLSMESLWIGSGKDFSKKKGMYGKVKGGLGQRLKDMSPK